MYRIALALLAVSLLLAQPPQRGVAVAPSPVLAASAGEFYALIIGINEYATLNKLSTAVLDARSVDAELRDGYHFKTTLLEDSKATGNAIRRALQQYRTELRANDNLLIYFAGHGLNDKGEGRAYWLPYDYDAAVGNGISGEDLAASVRAIPARHVLVISDSCYSGDLVRSPPSALSAPEHGVLMERMLAAKSRTFIASGGDEPVADGGGDGHSVFTRAVLRGLKELEGDAFSSGDLFQWYLQQRVAGASRQTPKFAVVNASGHEDGDFVFVGGDRKVVDPGPVELRRLDAATETWELIKGSQRAEDFDDFAAAFPQNDLAGAAKVRAAAIRRAGVAAAVTNSAAMNPPVAPRAGQKKEGKDGLTYVWIEPGTFTVGCSPGDDECSDNEKPAHRVTIAKGFWMGQTPVTQAAYQRVVGTNPSHFTGDSSLPVEQVNWNEAKAYCSTLDMRLPTEAEWEYATRAGSMAARYGSLDDVAWYLSNSGSKTHPVGRKQPNAWGLYDMLGNVYQWMADWYDGMYYQNTESRDPAGPPSGQYRTLRGGSWNVVPQNVRVSYRDWYEPEVRYDYVGLRCVGE